MKYMIGYGIQSAERFIDEIINHKDRISEVYFSWGDFPNGRSNALGNSELTYISAMEKQMSDLRRMSENGLKFNLLLNGNCYGRQSLSRAFFEKIGETTDYILTSYGLSSITTTSPIIAKFIKDNFKDLEVRASVNMDIGTIEGMDYVSQYFDGYYMKREYSSLRVSFSDAMEKTIYAYHYVPSLRS